MIFHKIQKCNETIKASSDPNNHPCECKYHSRYYDWSLLRRPSSNNQKDIIRRSSLVSSFPLSCVPVKFLQFFGDSALYYSRLLYTGEQKGKNMLRRTQVKVRIPAPVPDQTGVLSGTNPVPQVEDFHLKDLIVIAPLQQFKIKLKCPKCEGILTPKGWYNRPRYVMGRDTCSIAIAELYRCDCKSSFIGWDFRILKQLPPCYREMYNIFIITCKSYISN